MTLSDKTSAMPSSATPAVTRAGPPFALHKADERCLNSELELNATCRNCSRRSGDKHDFLVYASYCKGLPQLSMMIEPPPPLSKGWKGGGEGGGARACESDMWHPFACVVDWPCNAVCGKDAPPPPGDHCERFFENACRSQGDHCNSKTNPTSAACSFSNCSNMCGAPAGLCPNYCNNGSMWLKAAAEYSWCRPCNNKRDAAGKPIGEPWCAD